MVYDLHCSVKYFFPDFHEGRITICGLELVDRPTSRTFSPVWRIISEDCHSKSEGFNTAKWNNVLSIDFYTNTSLILLYCSPVVLPGLLRKTVKFFAGDCQLLANCPLNYMIGKYPHVKSFSKHALHSDLSKYRFHVSTGAAFRTMPPGINIYTNSTIPHFAYI